MQHVIASGIDYKSRTLEIREKIVIPQHCLSFALRKLLSLSAIDEAIVLSTCNRFEIYAATGNVERAKIELSAFFSDVQRIKHHEKVMPDYTLMNEQAAEHLLRVASGLESMITGEGQILGQVKQSYKTACEQNAAGPVLSRLFQIALHCGKRVRHETSIARRAVSTGAAAIELIGRNLNSWKGVNALVVGAGGAGQMCVKQLLSLKNQPHLTVLNQSARNLEEIRCIAGAAPVSLKQDFDNRHKHVCDADVVFVTTAADHPLILVDALQEFGRLPLFIVDMAVPRNVDPSIGALPSVLLYTIDDLAEVVTANLAERAKLCSSAEHIIRDVLCRRWRSIESQ